MRHPRARTAGRLLSGAVAVLLAASGVLVAPVANLVPAQPVLAAASFADPFFREDTIFSGPDQPDVRAVRDGRPRVRGREGRPHQGLRLDHRHHPDDRRGPRGRRHGLLGPRPAGPRDRPGLPHRTTVPVRLLRLGRRCPARRRPAGATAVRPPRPARARPPTGARRATKVERLTHRSRHQPDDRAERRSLWDVCQQFPSHSGGGMAIGPDGQLYVATGRRRVVQRRGLRPARRDDPRSTRPVRAREPVRRPGDRHVCRGERADRQRRDRRGWPAALAGHPHDRATPWGWAGRSSGSTPTRARRRPATRSPRGARTRSGSSPTGSATRSGSRSGRAPSDLYLAPRRQPDLGGDQPDRACRVAPTPTTLPNAGWPCYEGPETPASFSGLGHRHVRQPVRGRARRPGRRRSTRTATSPRRSPTGPCFNPVDGKDGGSPTGLAFYQGPTAGTASYPAKYVGGLFFVDYDRDCLAFFPKTATRRAGRDADAAGRERASRTPSTSSRARAATCSTSTTTAGASCASGTSLAPVARATRRRPRQALAPVTVQLSGTTSSDPDPAAIARRVPLGSRRRRPVRRRDGLDLRLVDHRRPAVYPVGLEVESSNGLKDTASITVDATNAPPVPCHRRAGSTRSPGPSATRSTVEGTRDRRRGRRPHRDRAPLGRGDAPLPRGLPRAPRRDVDGRDGRRSMRPTTRTRRTSSCG